MAKSSVKLIFIDSSVLFSASKSRTGASALIMAYCKKGIFKGHISLYVITEVKHNISKELNQKVKQRLNNFLLGSKLKLVEPSRSEIENCKRIINEKDALILAVAISIHADYLLTLNTRDFMDKKLKKTVEPMKIATPKDFIEIEDSFL